MSLRLALDGRVINDHFPGIGRYAYQLAGALADCDEVRLTLLHDPRSISTRYDLTALAQARPSIMLQPIEAAPFSLAEQTRMAATARALRPDVWHSLYYIMPFFQLPRPIVLTLYDLIPLVLTHYWSARSRLIYRLAHRLALRRADRIITLSASAKSDLIRLFGVQPDRISALPAAVDDRFTPATPEAIAAIRHKYDLSMPYTLYVGINKPPKNLVSLIEAYARLAQESPSLYYQSVIAGAWDERYPEAKQRAAELGLTRHVRFLGPIPDDDLPTLYSGADLFVTASLYEGFGLPVLEAMACGTPVACSNTSSLPEVVGDAALLFDPLDVVAIASVIRHAMDDPNLRIDLKQRGQQRANEFSWPRVAQQTLEVYRSAISDSRA
jgi:glycosyltransferase involved in cell wall biosynthesis